MTTRIFELWIGNQASGKTYQLKKRLGVLYHRPTIRCRVILDRLGEYTGCGQVFTSVADFNAKCTGSLPNTAIFQLGLDPRAYDPILETAEWEGDFLIIADEARALAPAGPTWKGSSSLERIALAGRHLPNCAGELRPTHLILATQYPRSIHLSLREQARTVMVGQLSGENALDWVRGEFGVGALDRVAALGEHQWTCVQGKDPR